MNIVFVVDQLHRTADANCRIALLLAEQLHKQGHDVTLLGLSQGEEGREVLPAFSKELFQNRFAQRMNRVYAKIDTGSLSAALAVVRHPFVAAASVLRRLCGVDYKVYAYKKAIERCCKKQEAALCVAFTAPYYTARALARAQINAKKVVYMLDPYALHPVEQSPFATKQEAQVMKTVQAVFMPKAVYKNFCEQSVPATCSVFCFEFPFSEMPKVRNEEELLLKERQWLLFCGRLYPGLREIDFFLEVATHLPQNFGVCLIGTGSEFLKKPNLKAYGEVMGDRLQILPFQKQDAIACYTQQAATLVNLDNKQSNMVPSKLFELMATGKPLVNFADTKQGPSAPYMKRYPLGIGFVQGEESVESVAKKLALFSTNTANNRLTFSQVMELFPAHHPQFLARKLLEGVGISWDE